MKFEAARRFLGRWVRDHPHADQVHRIERFEDDRLIGICGRSIPLAAATIAIGVRQCPDCVAKIRQQTLARQKKQARTQNQRRPYVNK